jgi:hypothetical protein
MQTPEQRLEQIRALSRARSKKYYEANQAKISIRRQAERVEKTECIKNKGICDDKECLKCDEVKEAKQKEDNSKLVLNRDVSTSKLTDTIESISSKKFYTDTLKTLEHILDCADFNKCLKNSKSVIYKIESATQKKDPSKLYSVNTKKGLYQAILKLVDTLNIKISKNAKDAYVNKFESHAVESHINTKQKVANDEVMDFEAYLKQVEAKFGPTSKEYLIASLYNLSGFRDDLTLKIVSTKPKDETHNYIIIPIDKKKNLTIELNLYKTSTKYGQDIIPIPQPLSKAIRKYFEDQELEYQDYLFGSKGLSGFIKKFNDKMGLKISINKLRQMRVSSVLNNEPTVEERVKLSKEMKHKPMTSDKYQRKTKAAIIV